MDEEKKCPCGSGLDAKDCCEKPESTEGSGEEHKCEGDDCKCKTE